jgi:hypothetical protein
MRQVRKRFRPRGPRPNDLPRRVPPGAEDHHGPRGFVASGAFHATGSEKQRAAAGGCTSLAWRHRVTYAPRCQSPSCAALPGGVDGRRASPTVARTHAGLACLRRSTAQEVGSPAAVPPCWPTPTSGGWLASTTEGAQRGGLFSAMGTLVPTWPHALNLYMVTSRRAVNRESGGRGWALRFARCKCSPQSSRSSRTSLSSRISQRRNSDAIRFSLAVSLRSAE